MRAAAWALALVVGAVLAGCSADPAALRTTSAGESPSEGPSASGSASVSATPTPTPTPTPSTTYAVDPPGRFDGRIRTPDVLITGQDTLPADLVRRISAVKGVAGTASFSIASASIEGNTVQVAAVRPDTFRSFMPLETAQANFVWDRLAGGEVAVDNGVSKKLIGKGDMIRLGTSQESPDLHVGAYAPLMQPMAAGWGKRPWVQVAVNEKVGQALGMRADNALLVSTGRTTPSALAKQFKRILSDAQGVALQVLALEFDNPLQTAVLTGENVSQAVGTFSYTNGPNGTVVPESSWVRSYIRTETVPILGRVTCNKAMLPQFRAALIEIVGLGLASKIHPGEYAGCYYPRYINRDPSYGLSLHSWGIAFDINVPENQRGTVGKIDPVVVATFKKWGFAWGGDWNYTDPMHFEMNRVVRAAG